MMNATVSKPLAQRNHPRRSLPEPPPRSNTNPAVTRVPGSAAETPELICAHPEFAAIYAEHSRAIYYLALRMLSDPQKAEDATHDVFLKAFRKLDQFRGESSWRTWLYRIAINHCRNLQQTWNERHMFSNADEVVFETAVAKTDSPFR